MCAASSSPRVTRSRTAAQLGCFDSVTSRPYFLNRPSSCAMMMLAQSVRAMKPMLTWLFSGAAGTREVRCAQAGMLAVSAVDPAATAAVCRKSRREASTGRASTPEREPARGAAGGCNFISNSLFIASCRVPPAAAPGRRASCRAPSPCAAAGGRPPPPSSAYRGPGGTWPCR